MTYTDSANRMEAMSESMVERVALAIVTALQTQARECNDNIYVSWDAHEQPNGVCLDGGFDLIRAARAAIEAMREPTEAMLHADAMEFTSEAMMPMRNDFLDSFKPRAVWHAMIDAALDAEISPQPVKATG